MEEPGRIPSPNKSSITAGNMELTICGGLIYNATDITA